MSVERVREYLKGFQLEDRVREFDQSSATVELAAQAAGVEPARIAKTLSFKDGDGCILLVAAGDARVDNRRFRDSFGVKAKMLSPDEALALTGHPVGGVCPFAVGPAARVYLDESLRRFDTVLPAAGNDQSAVTLTPDELYAASKALGWADACKGWRPEEAE
jgi:prolyl-tRNA editing enzyme YbaK/EbsC (Cys-tRNA(Pro) deacylase)